MRVEKALLVGKYTRPADIPWCATAADNQTYLNHLSLLLTTTPEPANISTLLYLRLLTLEDNPCK